jgi:hypothetical protein
MLFLERLSCYLQNGCRLAPFPVKPALSQFWEIAVADRFVEMPKLRCPCGFVHGLSLIPDEGYEVIRNKDMDAFRTRLARIYEDDFGVNPVTPKVEAMDLAWSEMLPLIGLLYDCPNCGRILWRKHQGQDYRSYAPEDISPR